MSTATIEKITPKVVSSAEWLAARKEFLKKEKEFTRLRDELSRQRRELPWQKVNKNYVFEGGGPGLSPTCLMYAPNSSSITSCSARAGKKGARAVHI